MINLDQLQSAHKSFASQHRTMVLGEASDAARHIESHVLQAPLFKPRTRKLQLGTRGSVIALAGTVKVRGQNRTAYAGFIEYGTRPHVIRARRAQYLRFMWRGKLTFRKSVNHPGTRPYKFLYRAVNSAARICQQGLTQGMARIARSF